MTIEDDSARFSAAIEAHGLTQTEWNAFICPGYRIPVTLANFGEWTASEMQCDPAKARPVCEYQRAGEGLIERGLLTILSEEDIAAEEARCESFPGRVRDDDWFFAGCVDFTQAGFDLRRSVTHSLFGPESTDCCDVWVRSVEESQIVEVIGPSELSSKRRVQQMLYDPFGNRLRFDPGLERPVAIEEVTAPVRCGPWSPVRFLEFDSGFIATIRYRVLESVVIEEPLIALRMDERWRDPPEFEGRLGENDVNFFNSVESVRYDGVRSYSWLYSLRSPGGPKVKESPDFERSASDLAEALTLDEARDIIIRCSHEYLSGKTC